MPTIDAFIIDDLRRRPRDEGRPAGELPLELPVEVPERDSPPPPLPPSPEEERRRGFVILDV